MANEDAEALCVALQRKNLVDYVYTEDTDAIPYFVASLNEELDLSSTSFKIFRKGDSQDMITVIDIKVILRDLELSPKSFIDMCILSGCDFCSTVPKIGPIKSL